MRTVIITIAIMTSLFFVACGKKEEMPAPAETTSAMPAETAMPAGTSMPAEEAMPAETAAPAMDQMAK